MGKKKPDRMPTFDDYLLAFQKIENAPMGRNLSTHDLSHLPKKNARELLNRIANSGTQLRKTKNGYQRTNSSAKLELDEFVKGVEARAAQFKAEASAKAKEQRDVKSAISNTLNSIKSTINRSENPEMRSLSEIQANRVNTIVETARLRAQLDKKPFDLKAAQAKAHADVYGTPAAPVIKADLNTSDDSAVISSGKQDILQSYLNPLSGLIAECRKVAFSDGKTLRLAATSQLSDVAVQGEGSTLTGNDLVFSGQNVSVGKVGNRLACSREVLEDSPSIVEASVANASKSISKFLSNQLINGGALINSGNNIADHASVVDTSVASVAALAISDLTTLCSTHNAGDDEPVLVINSNLFYSKVCELYNAAGLQIQRENGNLYLNGHRVLLDDSLGSASSTTSGTVLAVAGSIKRGCVLVERDALKVHRSDEILAANDQVLLFIGGRYGLAVQEPDAISRLTIA